MVYFVYIKNEYIMRSSDDVETKESDETIAAWDGKLWAFISEINGVNFPGQVIYGAESFVVDLSVE